jgi:hypothetical protein
MLSLAGREADIVSIQGRGALSIAESVESVESVEVFARRCRPTITGIQRRHDVWDQVRSVHTGRHGE